MARAPARASRLEPAPPAGGRGPTAPLARFKVALSRLIGGLVYETSGTVTNAHESAIIAVAWLEAGFGNHLAPLAHFLLRSESIASRLEHVDAGWRAFGRAFAGGNASDGAKSQHAAVRAPISMVDVAGTGPTTLGPRLVARRLVMAPGYSTARVGGTVRDVQNWIGGSDYTPSARSTCRLPQNPYPT